jgi:hypothetical protein
MQGCRWRSTDSSHGFAVGTYKIGARDRNITEGTCTEAEESSAKTSPQPAAPSVSAPLANSGISRQELDEALQSAFARFKSESTSIPTQPFAASLENPVTPSAVPPKSVANGGPGLPVAESHDVRWGSKKPAEPVPTATPPTQRAPVTPPRQSSNLPPAAQEVPIKF